MQMYQKLTTTLLLALLASHAQAAGVGVRAGTTGLGADVAIDLIPTLSGRLGFSSLDLNRDITKTDVRYEGQLKLSNLSALLDWRPIGPLSPVRLTGGLVAADNKFSLNGRPTGGTYELNGHTYQASQVAGIGSEIKGRRSVAPYLGLGWGNVAGAGINFYSDFGVIMQGGSRASVAVRCGSGLPASQCSQLQADGQAEQHALQDRVDNFKLWPVLNVGLTVGF